MRREPSRSLLWRGQRPRPYRSLHRGSPLVLPEAEAALEEYERAVEIDPTYAEAWAELVYLRGLMAWNYGRREQIPEAQRALETLEALGPDLEEAHLARGYFRYYALGDFDGALEALELFQETGPRGIVALLHRRAGRLEEARAIGQALLQDATANLALLETYQVRPMAQGARLDRAFALALLDRNDEALAEVDRASSPGWLDAFSSPAVQAALTYTELARPAEAIAILADLLTVPSELTVDRLRLDPRWDPLREEPDFQALLEGRPATSG